MKTRLRLPLFLALILLLLPALAQAQPVRHKLDNGLTVIIDENHEAPVASFQVWVRAGSAFERPHEYGITHLIEHMIFKGSPKHPHGEMARRIEALGGSVNAYTTYDHTKYYATAASRYAPEVLDLLADAVANASFDSQELKKEKEVVIEEIRMGQDDPSRRFFKAIFRQSFGDHPYGRPVIGSIKSVRAISRDDILNYRARWYRTPNMVVTAVGDFKAKEILDRIQKAFAGVPSQKPPKINIPPVPKFKAPKLLVMREKVRQASISLAWITPGLPSDDVYALDMAATVLGEGETSRLWSRLKEKKGLVDSVSAGAYTPSGMGLFMVRARTAPDKVMTAWQPMLKQALSLVKHPPKPGELKRANVNLTASFVRERQTMGGQASNLGYFEMMRGGYEKAQEYLDRFRGLSASEVSHIARSYLNPGQVSLVIQIPEKAQAPDVAALAKAASQLAAKLTPPAKPDQHARKVVLKNGLTLIVQPRRAVPLVALSLVAPGGQAAEPKGQSGLYALWSRSITRGSQKYSYEKLTSKLESMAANLNGFSGKTTCGLSGSFLARDWAKGLDLLAEVWQHPTFPTGQVAKAKAEQSAALRAQQDSPPGRAFIKFKRLIYGDHPYGNNVLGTSQSLKALGPEQLMAAHKRSLGPGGLVLAVVGDVNSTAVIAKVKALFGKLKGQAIKPAVSAPAPITQPRHEEIKDPKAKQTQIVLGYAAPSATDPKRHTMEVLDAVLGGMGGRLFSDLRDQHSLAYVVQPFFSDSVKAGVFGVYMAVGPGKETQALKGLGEHLKRIGEQPPSAKELERAKAYLLGGLAIGLQSYGAQASSMASNEYLGLGYDYDKKLPADISAVSAQELSAAAREYLNPKHGVRLTLGP